MKKIVALMLALMLCLSMTAMAEVPSKTASDAVGIEVTTENEVAAGEPAPYINIVSDLTMTEEELAKYEDLEKLAEAEIAKLEKAESVEDYFGEVKGADGNAVDLQSLVTPNEDGSEADLSVYEFYGLVAGNYDESMGKVTATLKLPTPYADGEKVGVMVGLVNKTEDAEEEYTIDWTALEGTVETSEDVETVSSVKVEIEPELMKAIQDGEALLAIVSKTAVTE